MTTRQSHGPRGNFNLRYEFRESDLGQRDFLGSADVSAGEDGTAVVLTVIESSFEQTTTEASNKVCKYQISAAELERLIVEHGDKVD